MAHKKGLGSSKNGRDSNPQFLGVKIFAGQLVTGGEIIVRQRGSRFKAGDGVGMGKDDTLFARAAGRRRLQDRPPRPRRLGPAAADAAASDSRSTARPRPALAPAVALSARPPWLPVQPLRCDRCPPRRRRRTCWSWSCAASAQFMVILDVSIVNVALPSIRERPRLLGHRPAVGRQRLHADLRRLPAARRPRRRPARPARGLRRRAAAVRARLAGRRASRRPTGMLIAARARCRASAARSSRRRRCRSSPRRSPRAPSATARSGCWGAMGGVGGATGALLGGVLTAAAGLAVDPASSTCRSASSPRSRRCASSPERPARGRRRAPLRPRRRADRHRRAWSLLDLRHRRAPTSTAGARRATLAIAGARPRAARRRSCFIEAPAAPAPLVPLRIFRSRTLTGANLVVLLHGLPRRSPCGTSSRSTCSRCWASTPIEAGLRLPADDGPIIVTSQSPAA